MSLLFPKSNKNMQLNIIPEQDRPSFPFQYFRDHTFDLRIFSAAREFIKNYGGGPWDCIGSEGGVAFMRPKSTSQCVLVCPGSKEELEVDHTMAGLVITHAVILGMIEDGMSGYLRQHYYLKVALADYCIEQDRGDVLKALLN